MILAGTNDLAGNTGPMTLEETEENLWIMAELATANHIKVVLCSVTAGVRLSVGAGIAARAEDRHSECVDQGICGGEAPRFR